MDLISDLRESCGQVGYGGCGGPAVQRKAQFYLDFVEAEFHGFMRRRKRCAYWAN